MATDYSALSLNDSLLLDRIDAALTDLTGDGVDVSKAISLVALSINEGAVLWGQPRGDSLYYAKDQVCNDYRQILGWEGGGGLDIPSVVLADQATMDYLSSRGGVDPTGTKLQAPFFHGFDSNHLDCPELARLLEWAVDTQNTAPLYALSLGPTQMALRFSALYTGAANKPGYPTTWDELWQLYNAASPSQFADQVIYLDPLATGITTYPADHVNDDATNIAWLQFQTGGNDLTPGDTGYPAGYYQAAGKPDSLYQGWLERTMNRAKSLGLI